MDCVRGPFLLIVDCLPRLDCKAERCLLGSLHRRLLLLLHHAGLTSTHRRQARHTLPQAYVATGLAYAATGSTANGCARVSDVASVEVA
jgi:hypothetical protein